VTLSDYKDLFYRLMPKGPVWPVDATSTPVWDSLLEALSQEPARISAVLKALPAALIPTSDMGSELLDLWEAILGLSPADTDPERVVAIRGVLNLHLSPSIAELQAYADVFDVGAVVTHHEYQLFLCSSDCNATVRGDQWLATWTVTYNGPQSDTFEAAILAVAPVHTTVLFVVV
jgi:uncharacterized protein YmfQ (DUF2313 family)